MSLRARGRLAAVLSAAVLAAVTGCNHVRPQVSGSAADPVDGPPVAADAAEETEVAALPPEAESTPPPDVKSLAGLDGAAVVSLLGQPDFSRVDEPATILSYRRESCVLDLFLYRPDGGGDFAVTHVEARGREQQTVSTTECLRQVFETRQVPTA